MARNLDFVSSEKSLFWEGMEYFVDVFGSHF